MYPDFRSNLQARAKVLSLFEAEGFYFQQNRLETHRRHVNGNRGFLQSVRVRVGILTTGASPAVYSTIKKVKRSSGAHICLRHIFVYSNLGRCSSFGLKKLPTPAREETACRTVGSITTRLRSIVSSNTKCEGEGYGVEPRRPYRL